MTQEEKQLLLFDISSRFPYGLHIKTNMEKYPEIILDKIDKDKLEDSWYFNGIFEIIDCKPYLRPLSSMMQGEWEEMTALIYPYGRVNLNNKNELLLWLSAEGNDMPIILMDNVFSWLDKNMFDYRGLIEKGLALEAPEGMYNN